MQNVGAYGQEVSQTIESVLALDLRDGQLHELCKEACGFSYRTSIFNTTERGRYVVLQVNYVLHHGDAYIAYADLKKYFAGWSVKPTLGDVRDAVRKIRSGKGMLLTPGDEDCRSVGSFFKNPILSQEQYEALKTRAAAKNLQIPSYPTLDAQKKVSAAWRGAGRKRLRASHHQDESIFARPDRVVDSSCGRRLPDLANRRANRDCARLRDRYIWQVLPISEAGCGRS